MSIQNVAKFTIKNKRKDNNNNIVINENKWRHIYEYNENSNNTEVNYEKQLPWMTLYKSQKDLLQIRMVTTIGYVEKADTDPSGVVTYNDDYEARFIKGFPLLLQSPDINSHLATDWEHNWPFYIHEAGVDFSGNLQTSYSGNSWLGEAGAGTANSSGCKVITGMRNVRNLLTIDLNDSDFLFKNSATRVTKFFQTNGNVKNYPNTTNPEYLVIRLDNAVEESTFSYDGTNSTKGLYTGNSNYWQSSSDDDQKPKLKIFNYVYYGYVISPYTFMSAFTTDFLRGIGAGSLQSMGGKDRDLYINNPKNSDTHTIQVNSKFFSETHSLKDGWDDRGHNHSRIKPPFYYNFFLQPNEFKAKDASNNSQTIDRFDTISLTWSQNLYSSPKDANGNAQEPHIEKLYWCSLTSPRHTIYTRDKVRPGDGAQFYSSAAKIFLPNYLNVNEVDPSFNINTNQAFFNNPNADYMPIKTSTGFKASGYIGRFKEGTFNLNYSDEERSGSNTIHMSRKTLTPYYIPNWTNANEYNKYAFNWNQNTTWPNTGLTVNFGITTDISAVDVSNCEVIEFRNLVQWNGDSGSRCGIYYYLKNTGTQYKNNTRKTVTFLNNGHAGNPVNNNTLVYKNGVTLLNNNCHAGGRTNDQSRQIQYINGDEEFIVYYTVNDPPNTSKHIYVMDIASGSYYVPGLPGTASYETHGVKILLAGGTGINHDTFIPPSWDDTNKLFELTANVYQIKMNTSLSNGTINREEGELLNFSLDSDAPTQVSIYNEPYFTELDTNPTTYSREPIFGYYNFFGLTSSEFLGGIDWYNNATDFPPITQTDPGYNHPYISFWLKNLFKSSYWLGRDRNTFVNSPYFLLNDNTRFTQDYDNISRMFFNPNFFYGTSSFELSNIFASTTSVGGTYNSGTDTLFIDEITNNPDWRVPASTQTEGLEITNFSNHFKPDNVSFTSTSSTFIFFDKTSVEFFSSTLIGKFNKDTKALTQTNIDNNSACIELNNGVTLTKPSIITNTNIPNSLKLNCLNFYKLAYVASQKNLFISDYWQWKNDLTILPIPPTPFNGIIPDAFGEINRNLQHRYNVYDWQADSQSSSNPLGVPSIIYTSGVHNPEKAYQNQSLISFAAKVSTISINVSHLLVNTWAGNLTNNNNLNTNAVVGLSSFSNSNGGYDIIKGSPILRIAGGSSLTPSIEESPVYLKIEPNQQFNFATDKNKANKEENEFSKAPMDVKEVNGDIIPFPNSLFQALDPSGVGIGGWFKNLDANANGIFDTSANGTNTNEPQPWDPDAWDGKRNYRTIDFSANILKNAPSNIILGSQYTQNGGFTKEEEAFPIELLFCYPFTIPDSVTNPNNLVTTYHNSDGEITNQTFQNYKGYKRYSKLYAIKVSGDENSYNNINFIKEQGVSGREIFPTTIIVNCVELPPPVQVNNFNDMLASDNSEVKLVWKGYNFDYSSGNARSQLGNIGNIVWKIERFQTQLETRKTVFEGQLPTSGGESQTGYNLSTYVFNDTNIRIYDKYKYTVSGTFIYRFKRTAADSKLYELTMPFGSFTTDEIIICKNNKFEYGRYNTTSTNLKLYRPLLLTKPGGQKDQYNRTSAGGTCLGNIFSGSTNISSTQNIYANTSNQLTKKQTFVLLSKQQFRPFR